MHDHHISKDVNNFRQHLTHLIGVLTSLVVAILMENSQKSPIFRKPEIENGKRIGTRRYRRVPYIWSVFWYYYFFITVKITENFRVENIWCRSKSPFPPRNGRFQTPNAAEARNSCATYIADHVRTELILKIIEESWVGLRWYLEKSKNDHFLAFFGKNGKLQNPNVWHSTVYQNTSCCTNWLRKT